jgi:hypothetical protein
LLLRGHLHRLEQEQARRKQRNSEKFHAAPLAITGFFSFQADSLLAFLKMIYFRNGSEPFDSLMELTERNDNVEC